MYVLRRLLNGKADPPHVGALREERKVCHAKSTPAIALRIAAIRSNG